MQYPTRDEMTAYIAERAASVGIDPNVAVSVARSEGLNADPSEAWQSNVVKNGQRERSYGPFQLYIDGGLGNEFMTDTGLDPRDPSTWQQQVDYSLDYAKNKGWGAWYGAANAGIPDWKGIGDGSGKDLVNYAQNARSTARSATADAAQSRQESEMTDQMLALLWANEDEMQKAAGIAQMMGIEDIMGVAQPKPIMPTQGDVVPPSVDQSSVLNPATGDPIMPNGGASGVTAQTAPDAISPTQGELTMPDMGMILPTQGDVMQPTPWDVGGSPTVSTSGGGGGAAVPRTQTEEDEGDPWNWKLSLFEGLEGFSRGLGQMSVGQGVDHGPTYTRHDTAKANSRNADIAQQNADTAARREARESSKPGDIPINRVVVAQAAQAAGLPPTYVDAIVNDQSGKVAQQAAEFLFSPTRGKDIQPHDYADPAVRQSIADAAVERFNLDPSEGPIIAANPAMAEEYSKRLAETATTDVKRDPAQMLEDALEYGDDLEDLYAAGLIDPGAYQVGKVDLNAARRAARAGDDEVYKEAISSVSTILRGAAATDSARRTTELDTETEEAAAAAKAAAVSDYIATQYPEYEGLSEMAALQPERAMAELNDRIEREQAAGNAAAEVAEQNELADALTVAANGYAREGDVETAEKIQMAAQFARQGNPVQAAAVYKEFVKDQRPEQIQVLEALMQNADTREMALELRRATVQAPPTREDYVTERYFGKGGTFDTNRESIERLKNLGPQFDAAAAIVRDKDFDSGLASELLLPLRNLAESFGIETEFSTLDTTAGSQEFVRGMMSGLIQYLRAPNTGHMSDFDAKAIQQSIVAIANTPNANRALLQARRRLMAAELNRAEGSNEYAMSGGDLTDFEARDDYIAKRAAERGLHDEVFYDVSEMSEAQRSNLVQTGKLVPGDMFLLNGELVHFTEE